MCDCSMLMCDDKEDWFLVILNLLLYFISFRNVIFTRTSWKTFSTLFKEKNQLVRIYRGGLNNLLSFIECKADIQKYYGHAWKTIKTRSEIEAVILVTKHTTLPSPKVVAYWIYEDNGFGAEGTSIIRTQGKSLRTSSDEDDIWSKLSFVKNIIEQDFTEV
jgi:hypothetical protein